MMNLAKGSLTLEKKRSLSGYIFCLPWLIGFLIFQLYPLITSFRLSISEITDLSGLQMKLIGFSNYVKLFREDVDFVPAFLQSIKTTVLYTPFIVVIAIVIAILLNQKIKGRSFFRVVFFLPVLLGSGVVMSQLGNAANIMQMPAAVEMYVNYYFSSNVAEVINSILSEIISVFWSTGVQIIILLGGLQSIPDSYYEAARVDNANSWDMLWKITLPILSPMIFLTLIYTIIDSFRDENNEISSLIVNVGFKNGNDEYGASMGWVYFLVVGVVVILATLAFRRYVYYEK